MCTLLSCPCVHTFVCYPMYACKCTQYVNGCTVYMFMMCVNVQFGDLTLMFFSLCFTLNKEKVLKARLQTSLAKTLAPLFSRCTLLRKGAAARVMWLLVFCPNKQAVHSL